jgi:hypothetical protein
MKRFLILTIGFAVLSGGLLCAQEIAGDWQGTVPLGGGLRTILKISKAESGGWKAVLYSMDQMPDGIPVSSISLLGSDLAFAIDNFSGRGDNDGSGCTASDRSPAHGKELSVGFCSTRSIASTSSGRFRSSSNAPAIALTDHSCLAAQFLNSSKGPSEDSLSDPAPGSSMRNLFPSPVTAY